MKYVWIDPPSGYIWGFPKLMPIDTEDVDMWLHENGYPAFEKDTGDSRAWPATDEEVVQWVATSFDRTQ